MRVRIPVSLSDRRQRGLDQGAEDESHGLEERNERDVRRPLVQGGHLGHVRPHGGVES